MVEVQLSSRGDPKTWTPTVQILWGNNKNNDRAVLRYLLNGGAAFDMRTREMIVAPTLKDLPPGVYHVAPPRLDIN